MAHAYRSLFGHLIFHVKTGRISTADLPNVHAYMHGVLTEIGGRSITIGGIGDHVHILAEFPFDKVGYSVRMLKTRTTRWLKQRNELYTDFAWQRGYGLFSVSRSLTAKVSAYILNQHIHHDKITAMEEYIRFIELHELEYHPEWD